MKGADDIRFNEEIAATMIGMMDRKVELPRSIWHHVRARHLELAAEIAERSPVYLDSRFWFDLRQAHVDQVDDSSAASLLRALRDAVSKGKIFCPISASTLIELLKHADKQTRTKTAQLVDELSLGVAVVNSEQLAESELEWLASHPGDKAADPLIVPIWTKASNSFGSIVPDAQDISAVDQIGFTGRHL